MSNAIADAAPRPPIIGTIPLVSPAGTARLPLYLVFGYVAATFILFLVWPINWPIFYASDWARLIGYVLLCLAMLGAAAFAGSAGPSRITAPLPWLTAMLVLGALVSVVLLVPSSYAYTGRSPWDVLDSLSDQGAAYRRLQAQLLATTGQRNLISALRAAAAPLTMAVLPLGIIHWRRIGLIGRGAVLVTVACSVIFSIMRGTDKEIADLFVIGVAAAFVSYGRSRAIGQQGFALVRRYWKPVLVALVFLYFAQGLFTERKEGRLGGYVSRTAICANNSRICADLSNPWISWLPQRQRFGLTFFILSTCSGYYGLELALEKPFESAYGVGHSPAAMSIYEQITDDPTLHYRTFTYRNGGDLWSEKYYWSTLMTWIANDVGFIGAIPILGLIGFFWGRWWREAAAGMSDPAAVLFVLATMTIFYLPANNQLLANYDGYTVLGVWLAIWLWHRSNRAMSAAVTG